MDDAFQLKLQSRLAVFENWLFAHKLTDARLVQYCGNDLVGALDFPLQEVSSQIESLLREGFFVDWNERNGRLFLRVWEYGGPEPDWENVFQEQPLLSIDEVLRRAAE